MQKSIYIGLQEQHKNVLSIIGNLTDDRNRSIQTLAELKIGYRDLLVAVYDGCKPQSELDSCSAEMQRLQWLIENEPVSQAIAVFHQKAQAISLKMETVSNQERVIANELKYRKQFNLVISTDKINSVRDWDILESDYQRHHFQDLQKLKDLRSDFNNVTEAVRLLGFVAYSTDNGCGLYNENVSLENINQPRA